MALFKKNIVVGVSVNPEIGLEVAQIDFATKTVLKYGKKQLAYDNLKKEIADLDLFKETLAELLVELAIPKGSEIILNIPTIAFKVVDYPAMMEPDQVEMAIEEELGSNPFFQNAEIAISAVKLPVSTIQSNKFAYTAAQKIMLIELAIQIKSLGYKLIGIETSVNSTLNSLIYNDRVDAAGGANWVLLIVENNACRILPMVGSSYVDSFEEKIAIGEVLGDAENYETVISAVSPLLKNLPSNRLYVLSKTSIISAQKLAEKLTYNGQIIHHDDNMFSEVPYLETTATIDEQTAKNISLDVIGAAIDREFAQYSASPINLFNSSLGEVYESEQPLTFTLAGKTFVLSIENMLVLSVIFAVIVAVIAVFIFIPVNTKIIANNNEIKDLETQIAKIEAYLKEHPGVSADMFSEGDEVRIGLLHNKNVYTYYTIVGTEIPKKLWLTSLELGKNTTIEGQADNLESIYSFYRNIKEYNPESAISLQKLGLASKSKLVELAEDENFDTDSIITSMNADFYEFRISDAPEVEVKKETPEGKPAAAGLPNVDLGE